MDMHLSTMLECKKCNWFLSECNISCSLLTTVTSNKSQYLHQYWLFLWRFFWHVPIRHRGRDLECQNTNSMDQSATNEIGVLTVHHSEQPYLCLTKKRKLIIYVHFRILSHVTCHNDQELCICIDILHLPPSPTITLPSPTITHHHPLITLPSLSHHHPPITLPSLSHPPTLLPYLSSCNSFQIRKSSLLCLKTCTNMYKQLPPSKNGILTCFPYLEFAYITK